MGSVLERLKRLALGDPAIRAMGRFNREHRCNIHSVHAALGAIKGSGVFVGRDTSIDGACSIGSNAWIGDHCNICHATIGNYAAIAPNCAIGLADHDISRPAISALLYEGGMEAMYARPCSVGPDAWIGAGAIVRRGVSIGQGAVVGANSFVKEDVPAFAVVAGSPAKVIRQRFNEGQIRLVLESKWWEENDLQKAKVLIADLERKFQGVGKA